MEATALTHALVATHVVASTNVLSPSLSSSGCGHVAWMAKRLEVQISSLAPCCVHLSWMHGNCVQALVCALASPDARKSLATHPVPRGPRVNLACCHNHCSDVVLLAGRHRCRCVGHAFGTKANTPKLQLSSSCVAPETLTDQITSVVPAAAATSPLKSDVKGSKRSPARTFSEGGARRFPGCYS